MDQKKAESEQGLQNLLEWVKMGLEKKKHPVLPSLKPLGQSTETQIKQENPEINAIQDLYGDIDPTIKLEDILKPLKDAKDSNPDKQTEIGKKTQTGDVEM